MIKVITVRYRFFNKTVQFIFKSGQYQLNNYVVFKCKNELGFGKVVSVDLVPVVAPDTLEATFRVVNKSDWEILKKIEVDEAKALEVVKEQVKSLELNFKILQTEYSFNKKKLRIFFSADEKIDFRILLKTLFKYFKILIEFKQVGVREIAQFLGGVGICGRVVCCKLFLDAPKKVTSDSAVNQSIYLGGTKFCGACGRLMCCLLYEEKSYEKSLKNLPKLGTTVNTPKGIGIVTGVNAVSEIVKVSFSDLNDFSMNFKISEISYI